MKAENVDLCFILCDIPDMYSKLFNSMKPKKADELLHILEVQISKKYGKYIRVKTIKFMGKSIKTLDVTPKGQIKIQQNKHKILSNALEEFLK